MKQAIRDIPVCCDKPMTQIGKDKNVLGKWLHYYCETCHKPKVELVEPSEMYQYMHRND